MNPLSINQILSASAKILENAQDLIEEAELLLKNKKNARAFALAHLACEELIKYNLLLPVAIELARDHSVDWKEIGIRLRSHHVKIRGAILLDFLRTPPQDGIYQSNELSQQMSTSEKLNNMKNYSLYTSQIDQEFAKPSELIDDETAKACVSHARELLQIYQMSYSGLYTLTGWTEEGLRHCIEMPGFQNLFQMLGSMTNLSNLPLANKQHSIDEITTFFNDTKLQLFLD